MDRLLQRVSTTTGCDVDRVVRADGTEVAIKRARDEAAAAHLASQTRHLRAMSAHLGVASIYPPIIEATASTLVLPWYRRGTLEDQFATQPRADAEAVVRVAADALFRVAAGGRELPDPARAPAFLADELVRRARRLRLALETADGQRFAAHETEVARALDALERWVARSDGFRAIGLPALGLCAHGDFGLDNALVRDDGQPLFIDVRGEAVWHRDLPWWDPLLDLATLLVYHCRIEPQIRAICDDVGAARLDSSKRVSEPELRRLCVQTDGFGLWAADDDTWEPRLELAMLVRLLGSVSTQLTATPRHQTERATAVWRLAVAQLAAVKAVLGG